MSAVSKILAKGLFNKESIITLLNAEGIDKDILFAKAAEIKQEYVGNQVHLRGLIELTNKCTKNCYYCGIGSSNKKVQRYTVPMPEVENAIKFTYDSGYGSVVIQTGELQNESFIKQIEDILHSINKIGNGEIGVTLSCGEQTIETYQRWREAGAHRYLLRIEYFK